MMKSVKQNSLKLSALIVAGMMMSPTGAHAASSTGGGGTHNFSDIVGNIGSSISNLPGLISALAYLFGILLSALGVMKIKEHVENPQTPLKDGAIRLLAGGALLALPMIMDAVIGTVGADGAAGQMSLGTVAIQ